MIRRLLLPALVLLTACADPDDTAGEADVAPTFALDPRIVNGTPSTAAKNSVVMLDIGGQGTCSGTLIAPNLVITARHCLANIDESTECGTFGALYGSATITIYDGITGKTQVAKGKQTFVESAQTSGCGHDIGLLVLDRDVAVTTSPVRLTALTSGEAASTSGFGENGNGALTNGRYDKNGLKIDAVGPANYTYKTKAGQSIAVDVPAGEIATGESTCFGDSGGPLFDASGNVVGVTSRGIDDSCIDRPSIYSDTATHVALIQDAAKAAGHPIADPPTPPGKDPSGTPSGDDNGTGDRGTGTGTTGDDTAGDDDGTTTPSKKRGPIASTGCTASPATSTSSSTAFAITLVLVGLVRARRRRS